MFHEDPGKFWKSPGFLSVKEWEPSVTEFSLKPGPMQCLVSFCFSGKTESVLNAVKICICRC